MATRREPWLILGLLLVGSLTLTGVPTSRAQGSPVLDATVLVTSRVDLDADPAAIVTVSAATITMPTRQASFPYKARGTVLVLVESGRLRIETDGPLPGVDREDGGEAGTIGTFHLALGERVRLEPGVSVRFGNDDPEPARLFLLTVVPVDQVRAASGGGGGGVV